MLLAGPARRHSNPRLRRRAPETVWAGPPAADFRLSGPHEHGFPGIVALYGLESPGLTSALAIGARVADMLEARSA